MKIQIVATTQPLIPNVKTAEELIVYCARVSNPESQAAGEDPERLLYYCLKKGHWSVFEMADMTVEIECTRAISRQILRHPSFRFQEFSQRYAAAQFFEMQECRLQDTKNRQSSIEVNPASDVAAIWKMAQERVLNTVKEMYTLCLKEGIAKEVARAILPEGLTMSKMYMKGNIRSWYHYCDVRRRMETQKEHRIVAGAVWEMMKVAFPITTSSAETLWKLEK